MSDAKPDFIVGGDNGAVVLTNTSTTATVSGSLLAARGSRSDPPGPPSGSICHDPNREPRAASRELRSSDIDFLVLSEDRPQGVGDLANGGLCLDGAHDRRNQVV